MNQMPGCQDLDLAMKECPPTDFKDQYYVAQVVKSFMVENGMLLAK